MLCATTLESNLRMCATIPESNLRLLDALFTPCAYKYCDLRLLYIFSAIYYNMLCEI